MRQSGGKKRESLQSGTALGRRRRSGGSAHRSAFGYVAGWRANMSMYPLACQTITFGPEQNKRFPEIFAAVSACGYKGVEIGFRHVSEIPTAQLADMLDEHGLSIVALHVGGNLLDPIQAAGEQTEIARVVEYAAAINVDMILYSGLRYQNELQFTNDLAMIKKSASICGENAIRLLYHNHNWEFDNDWRVMGELLSIRQNGFGLCPDLGWVYRSGANVIEFLEKAHPLIAAVHLKDFSSNDDSAVFTELGAGGAPLKEVASWLKANPVGGDLVGCGTSGRLWVILEQDESTLTPEDAVKINAEFGRSLFNGDNE